MACVEKERLLTLNNTEKKHKKMIRGLSAITALTLAVGVIGFGVSQNSVPASAQAQKKYDSVQTPYGRAPLSFADLVEKVRPAVVSIHVKGKSRAVAQRPGQKFRGIPDLPEDHPLNEFFKRFKKDRNATPNRRRRPSLAQGSGFFISEDGYIVTNHHVINNANEIQITRDGGEKLTAKLIGSDPRTDIALIKVTKKGTYPFVKFSGKKSRVGDWVLAVGNPFGLGGTVTAGIISARGRDIGSGPYDYLQIDAAVNRGNSGGPTFNLDGEVVGVNTAIFSPSGGNVGIAFAVPAELTKSVIEQLKSSGSVSRGWLGVTIQTITDDIAASIGLSKTEGALVTKITSGGPAARSDIEVGDAILKVNETQIKDSRDLARTIASLNPKTQAKITILRDGKQKVVSVKLGQFPGMKKLAKLQQGSPVGEELEDLGIALAPNTAKGKKKGKGVVITDVEPDSKAAEKGLKVGDVILEVGGESVNLPDDVLAGVKNAKEKGRKAVLMRVRSGTQQRFIALPLGNKKG